MKYKVGECARVKKDLIVGAKYGTMLLTKKMLEFSGKIVQVRDVFDNSYGIVGYGFPFFTDEMLEDPTDNVQTSDIFIAQTMTDPVNHPEHYTRAKFEAIEVIDAFFKDNYYLGQVFKYTARAGHKENELEDLKKAQWYLNRYIQKKEGK